MLSPDKAGAGPALAAAAEVGPYFAWEEVPDLSPAAPWRPFTDLDHPQVITERVDDARTALVERFALTADLVPERVVASVLFLGWAARIVSPPLAAVSITEVLPCPRREQIWWQPVTRGPVPVAWHGVTAVPAAGMDDDALAGLFVAQIVDGLVRPLLTVVRDRFRLSPKVLYGNVASALAGAAGMLADSRPDRAERVGRLLERLLVLPPLAGAATVLRPDPASFRRTLARHNCCLYYRIPGGGTCGDCVLRRSR